MIRSRIFWLFWLFCMAGAAVLTGTWLFAAILLLSFLLLIFSSFSLLFSGKKVFAQLHFSKAAEREESFQGKIQLENQSAWPVFGGNGQLLWENLFTGEKGEMPLAFSLGAKEKMDIAFEGRSEWCGCIRFSIADWKCQDFFRMFSVKRKVDAEAYTVVMPPRQKGELPFLTREGFDMESFRYSGNRPGDDPGETYDIREYQPGDSIRQIHWKLSGKLDQVMIRERSFPVDDTILILAEAYQEERDSVRAETVAEVFAMVLQNFMEKKIACQAAVYDPSTGKLRLEKIRSQEDMENILYLFLRYGAMEKSPVTVAEYVKNPGNQRFANYIYITGDPQDKEAQALQSMGEVTVLGCGTVNGGSGGEQLLWNYGSQNPKDNQKQNTEKKCQVSCWRLS